MAFGKKGLLMLSLVLAILMGAGVKQARAQLAVRTINILWNEDGKMVARTWHFAGRWVENSATVLLDDVPLSTVANTSLDVQRLEWLWVWNNGNRIEGIKQNRAGGFMGRPFTVLEADVPLLVPDITYNPRRDEHLLVYERLEEDGSITIVAQPLRPNGLTKGRPIIVARNAGEGPFPALARPAYSVDLDVYLVVWNKGTRIMGQALRGNGTRLGRPIVLVDNGVPKQPHPSVAYNTRRQDWLLTYTEPVQMANGRAGSSLYIRHLTQSYRPIARPEHIATFDAPIVFNSFYNAELDEHIYGGFVLGRTVAFTHWIRARTDGSPLKIFVTNPQLLPQQSH